MLRNLPTVLKQEEKKNLKYIYIFFLSLLDLGLEKGQGKESSSAL